MPKIISQSFGGLGDNLQYSTLPELYHQQNIECYISHQNVYRNYEIKELVWDCNPYILGTSIDTPNAGQCTYNGGIEGATSIIDAVEYQHGFPMTNHLPKIYYQPKILSQFEDKILIDFSAKSQGHKYTLSELNNIIKNSDPANIINIVPQKSINSTIFNIDNSVQRYQYYNIFEYVDLIYSCKQFHCLWSGSSVLSAAISRFKPDIDVRCYVQNDQEINFNINFYFFKSIKYQHIQ